MQVADVPRNEARRLATLRAYDVLDTEPELGFDDLTALAAAICGTPIALVSLVDRDRQWFKSRHGLDATQTPRDIAFCAHAILGDDLFVVRDAQADPRFAGNPLTLDAPHVRFYAGAPLITPTGDALGTLCVIDHAPRELDARQLDALRRLGRQVVSQLELRRARDEARLSARAKGEFLATMSHEIRTPLNGVIGGAELLVASLERPEQVELAETILNTGNHLLSVVNDVLDAARIEQGGMCLAAEPFDLRAVVEDTLAMTRHSALQKGLDLRLDWRSVRPPHRLGDAARLRQVLVNLVGNAVKFTLQGAVQVVVSDGRLPGQVRLEVRDTGIGIAPEVLPRLFERFVQADGSTTRRFGGSGLGLSICRELLALMGGELLAESRPGRGSSFRTEIFLPPACTDAAPTPGAHAGPGRGLSGRTVLVVDDDHTNRKLLTMMLAQLGCRVAATADGQDAVRACQNGHFDLVLMDSMMPGIDGCETTRRIRALDDATAAGVPIVAITASVMEDERARCAEAGMNGFLGKPITRAALEAVLPGMLRG